MNRSKKPKIHKKTKVRKLKDAVAQLKADLYRTRYDAENATDVLYQKLRIAERLAADMRPPIQWDLRPIDAYREVSCGRARRFVASEYVDAYMLEGYRHDIEPYLREKMVHNIAREIVNLVPILKQKDRGTRSVRWLVDFYLLFPDHKET
jgi:hypothetical protein